MLTLSTEQVGLGLFQHLLIGATILSTATYGLLQNLLEKSVRVERLCSSLVAADTGNCRLPGSCASRRGVQESADTE